MDKAKVKGPSGWGWKHPDAVRRWVRRWLEVRGAGRARQTQKGFHASDWAPDPCIASPRRRDHSVTAPGLGAVAAPALGARPAGELHATFAPPTPA
jgi:hypothetical protein